MVVMERGAAAPRAHRLNVNQSGPGSSVNMLKEHRDAFLSTTQDGPTSGRYEDRMWITTARREKRLQN